MNWEVLGVSSDVIGTFFLVASVIYVAQQVRQNTTTSRAEALRTMSLEISNQFSTRGMDERSSGLWYKIIYDGAGRSDLSNAERMSMSFMLLTRVSLFDAAYRSYREGIIKESEFLQMITSTIWKLQFMTDSWHVYRTELSPDFVAYMEGQFENLKNPEIE